MKKTQSNHQILSAWFTLEQALKDSPDGNEATLGKALSRPQTSKLFRDYSNYHSVTTEYNQESMNLRPLTAQPQAITRPVTAMCREQSSLSGSMRKLMVIKVSSRPHPKHGFNNIHLPPKEEPIIPMEELQVAIKKTSAIHNVDVDCIIDLYSSKCIDRGLLYQPEHALLFTEKFRKQCVHQQFHMEENQFGFESARCISRMLMADNHFNITPAGAYLFMEALQTIQTLASVDISSKDGLNRNKVSVRGCEPLELLFKYNHPLEFLNLRSTAIQQAGFECILAGLEHNTSLQYLNVSSNELNAESASYMHTYLQNSSLMELDLSHNPIGNAGMDFIGHLFEKSTFQLRRINLTNCQIKSLGILKLLTVLPQNRFLEKLILDDNFLQGNGFNHIEAVLLSRCPLQYLSLAHCQITAKGADYIGNGLERNKTLKTLILRDNRICDFGGEGIFKGQCFQKLDLRRCNLTDNCGLSLCQMIKNSQQLQQLILSDNDFHDVTAVQICEAAKINPVLTVLDVSENPLNFKYQEELGKLLTINKVNQETNKIPDYEREVMRLKEFNQQKKVIDKETTAIKSHQKTAMDALERAKEEKERVRGEQQIKTANGEMAMQAKQLESRQVDQQKIQIDQEHLQILIKLDDEANECLKNIAANNQTSLKLEKDIRQCKDTKHSRRMQIEQRLDQLRRADFAENKQLERALIDYKQLEDRINRMQNKDQKSKR